MIKDEFLDLIGKGESENTEFKEKFDREAIETAVAFANTKGGIILIGVTDKAKVKGIQIGKETMNDWANQLSQSTEPRIIPEIEKVEIGGKSIGIIQIKEFPIKPVSVKGRCFRRVGTSNRMMTPQEISEMHIHSMGTSWDAFPAGDKTLGDIDLKRVEKYIKEANATGRRKIEDGPAEVLLKLEFIKDGKATWAAILTFGKEPQRPLLQSAVHCGKFRMDKTQIIDDLMVETDLIGQVEEVMKFVTRHISVRYEFEGKPRRKEVWEYPLEALREAIINAIVHRDYTAPSNVQVEIYDDRIEIWNSGRLLPWITIDDLYKKEHKSVIRNKLIAQVFYDIGYIEKYGSGTVRIVDLSKQHGLPAPEFKEVFGGFSVVFRKDIYTEEYLRNLGLNERQIKAVMYVKEKGSINLSSFKTIVADVSDKTLYRDLQELVSKRVLKELGRKKGRRYELL
ncbi:MAG: putative DNA binding domain-containing protein [Nitrospirae bacterium]|nr:putative DNA binding domain-containing protein [Nitrospirota bacterium]